MTRDQLADEVCPATHSRTTESVTAATTTIAATITIAMTTDAGSTNNTIDSFERNDSYVDRCANLPPEKAKLNLLLLLMNGVRLVFTKTVAFSTILTVRALLG